MFSNAWHSIAQRSPRRPEIKLSVPDPVSNCYGSDDDDKATYRCLLVVVVVAIDLVWILCWTIDNISEHIAL